jgi:hypothetical protein
MPKVINKWACSYCGREFLSSGHAEECEARHVSLIQWTITREQFNKFDPDEDQYMYPRRIEIEVQKGGETVTLTYSFWGAFKKED